MSDEEKYSVIDDHLKQGTISHCSFQTNKSFTTSHLAQVKRAKKILQPFVQTINQN
jgi:tRNA G10  N-methylase Trm11